MCSYYSAVGSLHRLGGGGEARGREQGQEATTSKEQAAWRGAFLVWRLPGQVSLPVVGPCLQGCILELGAVS